MFKPTATTEYSRQQRILRNIRRGVITICGGIILIYLIPPLREALLPTIRQVFGPVLNIAWGLVQGANYAPQPVIWIYVVLSCALALGAALYSRPTLDLDGVDYTQPPLGPLGKWHSRFTANQGDRYAQWKVTQSVAALVVETVAQDDQISDAAAKARLRNHDLNLPVALQKKLAAGLARSRTATAALSDAELQQITAYLADRIN